MNQTEAMEIYRARRKQAKRYVQEHGGDEWGGCLPVLETALPGIKELSTVSLGIIDVPISRVRGTLAAGRAAALAGNFLPLLPETSEFAIKWTHLYSAHMSEGIRDPGTAYEYLGHYYIVEGHKRVSVLKAVGAPSVQLDVQRVLPPDTATDDETMIYKEFLEVDPRIPLRGMWFSKRGSFTELYALSQDGEGGYDTLFDAFFDFRACYHELEHGKLPITTGDAFLEFVKVYGVPYKWEPSALKTGIKSMERQLLYISGTPAPPLNPTSVVIVAGTDDERSVLRRQLEEKETLFLLRSPVPRNDILPTFYGKMEEPAFILGALAGSLTSTGVVGRVGGADSDDSSAFERGVVMVGAGNTVVDVEDMSELRDNGADIALAPYLGEYESGPGFPGVYARLVGLSNGYIREYYAAAAWDYEALRRLAEEPPADGSSLLSGHLPASKPLHIVLGIDSGLMKIHLNGAALSALSEKLVEILKRAAYA